MRESEESDGIRRSGSVSTGSASNGVGSSGLGVNGGGANGVGSRRHIVASLERLARILRSRVRVRGAALGMTVIQARVLLAISDARPNGISAGAIAREFGVAPATVSEAVRALESRGLLTRRTAPTDRRVQLLRPTPRGIGQAEELSSWLDPARRLMADRPAEEVQAIEIFLVELVRELDG